MPPTALEFPRRGSLLPLLHESHDVRGFLTPESVASVAREAGIPVAEAWEAATSYPDFNFSPPDPRPKACAGLSCALAAPVPSGCAGVPCQFRCYDAPAPGYNARPDESVIRLAGPLLAADIDDWTGLERARRMGPARALEVVDRSGLRGRGGAYFPVGRKWAGALAERRPVALVVNAEEGEPGVFKDRVLLCLRPRRFVEGLAVAVETLDPEVVVVFINGEAVAARAALEAALKEAPAGLGGRVHVVAGGGGYVLGEESALLNALEGRKPVPRLRPPFPVQSGLFGMPTVINNVETLTHLSALFREGIEGFRSRGTIEAPGTKLFSLSGRVRNPGLYEAPLGTTLGELLASAGGATSGAPVAALAGGPSGGFLPAAEFGRPLLPGLVHPTGAVAGSGGLVFLEEQRDLRAAALAMAEFNAHEACGKCTPCREGAPLVVRNLRAGGHDLDDLLDVLGAASLCGLGQMAPGPVRSALHFWPGLFA